MTERIEELEAQVEALTELYGLLASYTVPNEEMEEFMEQVQFRIRKLNEKTAGIYRTSESGKAAAQKTIVK